jgi:hypothetical protein
MWCTLYGERRGELYCGGGRGLQGGGRGEIFVLGKKGRGKRERSGREFFLVEKRGVCC